MIDEKKLTLKTKAPDFSLPDASGEIISLSDFKGRWIVLYFYPKDNTSGCTIEAVDFTSRLVDFKNSKAQVIGISPDSCESHQKFILNHGLQVMLLSDKDKKVLMKYGVWSKKSMYGRDYFGVERTTVLVDPEGKVAHIWNKVSVKGHVDDVFDKLKELSKSK